MKLQKKCAVIKRKTKCEAEMKKLTLLLLIVTTALSQNYWQQHVHYKIKAKLNPDENLITGSELLTYTNNSPDELNKVYFRLYWNLLKKNSHAWKSSQRRKMYQRFEREYKGVELKKFSILMGEQELPLNYKIDDTILEAELPKALKPGEKITFKIEWEEEVPPGPGIRTGVTNRCFDIAQWYPQIAVYDRYGWHKDQYIGTGEFHNDYGDFEVEIQIPKSFIVAYSGELLNPNEVLPDSVISKLKEARENPGKIYRIADFSNRTITEEERKNYVTWRFIAKNVRDFAWSAYEKYIWDAVFWKNDEHPNGGVMVHALYFKSNEKHWKDEAVKFGLHAIKFFSENFGLYVYPNAFVMSSYAVGGGMEYPGIVFIGHDITNSPYRGLFGVIVHELGHQWYPMMISNNETEFAFMDEGFNTFITTLAFEAYYGRKNNLLDTTLWFIRSSGLSSDERENNQRQYLLLALTGYEEPIATHADHWNENYPATTAFYPKTATVMFMLQYVLGDSTFAKLMKEYYNRWLFKHPYPDDFYKLAMEVSGDKDLRWFFDEWFHRTYTCDYAIKSIRSKKINENGKEIYQTKIKISRKGRAVMPIDIFIKMKNGETTTVKIPVDAWLNDEWENEVEIKLPSKPIYAEINPDLRIADINRLNNTYPFPKVKATIDNTVPLAQFLTPIDAYWLKWRPSTWYNIVDGVKLGLKFKGSFLQDVRSHKLWFLYSTKSGKFDFYLKTERRIPFEISRNTFTGFEIFKVEGRYGGSFEVRKRFSKTLTIPPFNDLSFKVELLKSTDNSYLDPIYNWDNGRLTRTSFNYTYSNRWRFLRARFSLTFESSTMLSDFSYSKVYSELIQTVNLPEGYSFALRFFAGYGNGQIPAQAKFFTATSSPIEQFYKPIYRSKIFPMDLRSHIEPFGGAGLRGYFDQNLPGDRTYSLNFELNLPSLLPFINRMPIVGNLFRTTFFFDAGKVWGQNQRTSLKDLRYDFGIGIRSDIIESVSSFTDIFTEIGLSSIRFDFPIYVSHPASGGKKFNFRWVIGFERTF